MSEFKLEQTKSKFKVAGVVTRLDNDNAYRLGNVNSGKNEGKEYRSLRFGVRTSDNNELFVSLFGMERDLVYPYNMKKRKSMKLPFDQRDNIPSGYHLIGINVNLEKDDSGKVVRKSLVEFDAVEEIFNNLEDGDQVFITGEVRFSTYENQQGQEIERTEYQIKSISKSKTDINFDAEDFVEVADFEQEIVFVDAIHDEEQEKVFVTGRTISWGDNWEDAMFTIDVSEDEDLKKLGRVFLGESLDFGDFLQVYGKCVNKAVISQSEQVEEEIVEDDNPFADAGKKKPSSLSNNTVKEYISELQIEGVNPSSFEKEKYAEDDFFMDGLVQDSQSDSNPFSNNNNNDNDDDDGDDDNLPF